MTTPFLKNTGQQTGIRELLDRIVVEDLHQPRAIRVRQSAEQRRVSHAENDGVGADAQCEGGDDNGGKAGDGDQAPSGASPFEPGREHVNTSARTGNGGHTDAHAASRSKPSAKKVEGLQSSSPRSRQQPLLPRIPDGGAKRRCDVDTILPAHSSWMEQKEEARDHYRDALDYGTAIHRCGPRDSAGRTAGRTRLSRASCTSRSRRAASALVTASPSGVCA